MGALLVIAWTRWVGWLPVGVLLASDGRGEPLCRPLGRLAHTSRAELQWRDLDTGQTRFDQGQRRCYERVTTTYVLSAEDLKCSRDRFGEHDCWRKLASRTNRLQMWTRDRSSILSAGGRCIVTHSEHPHALRLVRFLRVVIPAEHGRPRLMWGTQTVPQSCRRHTACAADPRRAAAAVGRRLRSGPSAATTCSPSTPRPRSPSSPTACSSRGTH
jgi:hypothetical protein